MAQSQAGGSLTTSAGKWTFGSASNSYGNAVLLNGGATSGNATLLEVANGGKLYAQASDGSWWLWNNPGWSSSSAPTGGGGISPDGSTLTVAQSQAGGSLTTSAGKWTFGSASNSYGNAVLLNGGATSGNATLLEVANGGKLYAQASDGSWWLWNNPGWSSSSAPTGGGGISPDGSTLTVAQSQAGGSLTTSAGKWTFGSASNSYGNAVLLNGGATSGNATLLEVANGGKLYAQASDGSWWLWNNPGWSSSSAPTGGGGISPDGSTLTVAQSQAGGSLTTSAGKWTFGSASNSYGNAVLLNGGATSGNATLLEVANGGKLYAQASDGSWWLWNNPGWSSSSAPTGGGGVCSPLTYGAVGDGTTDNTNAIQTAVDACAAQGGGTVELPAVNSPNVYVTGPFTLNNHVHLQIDQGVLLQAIRTHSRYVAAYINWVYEPKEALISATGATDVAILGAGIIDGAGNQPDPNDSGQTWYNLASKESATNPSLRPYLLEFYQCDHVTISGVTLRNAPYWNQALRFSSDITESGVTVEWGGPNDDGVDLVGATNVTLSNLNISVGDDDIAVKSGLPIKTSDPYYLKEIGLPQIPTSNVQITNITATAGDGIAIGSEAVNGVNNVTIQGVQYNNTAFGFRIKSDRARGGHIYNISLNNLTMTGVTYPLIFNDYYDTSCCYAPYEPPYDSAQSLTSTTPIIHDISIQNLVATQSTMQSSIEGLPESCINNVTMNNVSIQTSAAGMQLRHMTGTFTNVTVTRGIGWPFVVQENVRRCAGIGATGPQGGQIACSAQNLPPP